jgi:nucleotide-binding universal stress UspA family protein
MSNLAKNILIGTTLAEGSDEVVQAGFRLARANDATVHLVHVMPPSYTGEPGVWRKLFASLMEQAYRAGLEGIYFSLRVEPGQPCPVLEKVAGEVTADLAVVGASEVGEPSPQGLGSTADGLLRAAACPVLVVRGGALAPQVTRGIAGQVLRESPVNLLVIPPGTSLFESQVDLSIAA